MRKTVGKLKYLALGALLATIGIWGLAVTLPHTFAPGDEIKSSEINANFSTLADAVTEAEDRLAGVGPGQLALPSQQGKLAYVWVRSTGTADADYQFNSAGGTITATKLGTGWYRVTIPNIALNPSGDVGGSVQVSAYGLTPVFCKVGYWTTPGSDTEVDVNCFDHTGARADSAFTLLAVR